MALSDHLLTTKIRIPPLPPGVVWRQALLQRLDEGLQPDRRLTLLSTPPGYGKTTLLSQWIQKRKLRAAWIALDEGENDPARFLAYVHLALRRLYPQLEVADPGAESGMSGRFREAVLIPLLQALEGSTSSSVLILDDYHLLHAHAVHDLTTYLIEHLPPQAHIVIASRADPALPLAQLRGRGQLNELRMADLRFSPEEAIDLLSAGSDLGLPREQIEILHRRTEGWVSGLQMAATSLRQHHDPAGFMRDFSGTHRHILDYLIEEVLDHQPRRIQQFLLYSSILDRMCASICDALMEGFQEPPLRCQEVLEDIERANLFTIPLDDERRWYRYHRLFGDLLRSRLLQDHPDRLPELHRRASRWFQGEGLANEAIQHSLASGDHGYAAELIELASQDTLMRGETATFLAWMHKLPSEEVHRHPKLNIYQAWALLLHGAPLATVEANMHRGTSQADPPGSTIALEAFIALIQGQEARAGELAQAALAELPPEEIHLREVAIMCAATARISLGDVPGGMQMLEVDPRAALHGSGVMAAAMVLGELAELRMKQGRLQEAKELFERALALSTNPDGTRQANAGRALIGLGDLAREWNELDEAERLVREGMPLAERWSILGGLYGHITLAMIREAQGETQDIPEIVRSLRALALQFDATELDDVVVDLFEARTRIRSGDLAAGRRWAENRGFVDDASPPPADAAKHDPLARLHKYELPVLARLRIGEGRYLEAKRVLEELIFTAERVDRRYLWIEGELLLALAHRACGDHPAALASLRSALELAQAEAPMRVFLDEGKAIGDLLSQLRPQLDEPGIAAFADRLLAAFSPGRNARSARTAPGVIEPLSDRELEVLCLLPSALSGAEMANHLTISINTLRTHLKSIYAKLGVHSRQEAVARAAALDLLP